MHHKKSEVHQIRKLEATAASSSSYNQHHIPLPYIQPNPNPNLNIQQQQHHSQTQQHTHLRIQIPSLKDPNFEHEHISRNPATPQKPILSTPHKRTLMTQSPKHHPFTQNSTKYNHHQQNIRKPNLFLFCSNLVSIPILTRSLASRVCCHVCRARIYGIHLRFIVLLILPTLYFFASNTHLSFALEFICVIAFSIALLTSLNLALPRLPSIKLFLSRSLPSKFTSLACGNAKSHNPPPRVVWSIGSKPKTEKKLNSGFGVQVYSNGDVYEGEFHRGKCSGCGVYYYYRSGRYEGDWVDGKYDGYGVETWAKGSRYRGQYRQGLRHGVGVYRFYNGDVYAGEWSNGQSHGCGVHTCEDGSKYVGEFKWGAKHGLGHYHFRNGDTYAGEYFADKMHGFGVYQFGNGHRYEGAWHEGRRQGFGMYTFRNGERQCGHWQNGVVDVPSPRSIDAGSPTAVIHSKVLTAVQEARQAAERASEVGKIDDRVNKTTAAANKSANAARVAAVKAVQDRMFQNTSGGDLPTEFV